MIRAHLRELARDLTISALERVSVGASNLADRMRSPLERHIRAIADEPEDDDDPPVVAGGRVVSPEALDLVARRSVPAAPAERKPLEGSLEARFGARGR